MIDSVQSSLTPSFKKTLYIVAVAFLHCCSVICVVSDPVHNLVIDSCINNRHIQRYTGYDKGFIYVSWRTKACNTNQSIPGHNYKSNQNWTIVLTFRFLAPPLAHQNRHYMPCLYQKLRCHRHTHWHWKVKIKYVAVNFTSIWAFCVNFWGLYGKAKGRRQ